MQRKTGIIVCSAYQSQTSESIVSLIRQLCPSQEVTFQPLEMRTRFDGSKVVFCHSSLSGRLALTDVNYSIYDKAVKDASKTVGKENVAFVVTDVDAAETKLRKKMITQTQHTLMSNIHLLLLLSKVDVNEDMVRDNFTEFLTRTSLIDYVEQQSDYRTFPGSYELLKSLPQLAILVLIIACFASVNSRLDLFESHIQVVRKESFERMNQLDRTLKYLEEKMNKTLQLRFDISTLETSLREGMMEVENKMVVVQTALTKHLGVLRSELESNLYNRINDIPTSIQKTIADPLQTKLEKTIQTMQTTHLRNMTAQSSQLQSELGNQIKDVQTNLQTKMLDLQEQVNKTLQQKFNMSTLTTSLRDGMMKVENKILVVQTALTKDLEDHRAELQSNLYNRINEIPTSIQKTIADPLQTKLEKTIQTMQTTHLRNMTAQSSQLQSELGNQIKDVQTNLQTKMLDLKEQVNKTLQQKCDMSTLTTSLLEGMMEVENKILVVQTALTKDLEDHRSELQSNLYNRINEIPTSIQKTIADPLQTKLEKTIQTMQTTLLRNMTAQSSELQSELGNQIKDVQTNLQTRMGSLQVQVNKTLQLKVDISTLGTSLREGMDDHRMRLQMEVENKMVAMQTALTKNLEVHTAELQSNLYNRINDVQASKQETIKSDPLRNSRSFKTGVQKHREGGQRGAP